MATPKPAEGVEYTKPTTQLDLEARQARERGEEPEGTPQARDFRVEGNETDAYVGVSPEYMTYADDTSKPLFAEEGAEAEAEARILRDSGVVANPTKDASDGSPKTEESKDKAPAKE